MAQKNVTRDMTQGSPLKLILTFSLPLLGGFLFQQLYSFMDTMVVGGVLGTEALAAVGDTGSLNFLINGFCMGICSGFAIPIAQAFGAKDETEMRRYVMHSVYLCAVISVLMGLLTGFFAPQLLRMLNTPEDILPLSVAYIQPVFFAIPVTVLYNMCGGVMRSLGDSKTPVIAITIAALLNIVLDYTFILAFHMGVEGAAWATVISQLISGLWCLLVIRKRFTILKMQPEDKRIRAPFVRRLLAMGIPFGLQYSITAIGSLTVTYAVNGIGTIAVAAVTAGGKLSMFFCCVFDALASTMATFAGQNVGAKRLDRINQGLKASSIIGCVYCVLAFVVIYFFGKPLVGLFISQDSADRQLVIDGAAVPDYQQCAVYSAFVCEHCALLHSRLGLHHDCDDCRPDGACRPRGGGDAARPVAGVRCRVLCEPCCVDNGGFVPVPVLFYLHPQAAEAVVSREGGSFQQVKCVPLRCVPQGFFVSLRMDFGCCRGMRPQARNPRATRAYIMEESSTQSRERVKGQRPLKICKSPLQKGENAAIMNGNAQGWGRRRTSLGKRAGEGVSPVKTA